jgi:uncharacterized protein YdeI (YjbR/CyaY-like superfamily)
VDQRPQAKAFILQAIEGRKSGKKVEARTQETPISEELEEAFRQDKAFKSAFYKLSSGRQRGAICFIFHNPNKPQLGPKGLNNA